MRSIFQNSFKFLAFKIKHNNTYHTHLYTLTQHKWHNKKRNKEWNVNRARERERKSEYSHCQILFMSCKLRSILSPNEVQYEDESNILYGNGHIFWCAFVYVLTQNIFHTSFIANKSINRKRSQLSMTKIIIKYQKTHSHIQIKEKFSPNWTRESKFLFFIF